MASRLYYAGCSLAIQSPLPCCRYRSIRVRLPATSPEGHRSGDDVIQLNLPKGNIWSGLPFRAEADGMLVTGGNIEIFVQGPDTVGVVLVIAAVITTH